MLELRNVIELVDDGHTVERNWHNFQGITVHRVGEDAETGIVLGATAEEICDHFSGRNKTYPEVAKATGNENPYGVIVR